MKLLQVCPHGHVLQTIQLTPILSGDLSRKVRETDLVVSQNKYIFLKSIRVWVLYDLDVGELKPALQVPCAGWEGQTIAPPPGHGGAQRPLVSTLEDDFSP